MSIASKTNPTRAGHHKWSKQLLFEPENAEMKVSIIAGEKLGEPSSTPIREFAEALQYIKEGIETGKIDQTIATIELLVELAYLETAQYGASLERFQAELEGRLLADGSIEPRTSHKKEEADATATEQPAAADDNETIPLDSSGGELPPIPMSEALRDALQADASRCRREPLAQVVAILNAYYLDDKSELGGPKESNKDESQS